MQMNGSELHAKTLKMGVDNTGFIVDRLGRDCAPLQYIRELTQNSIEAILDTSEKAGEVVWDVDWNMYDLEGKFKASVIDTGVGMDGPEMIKYINQLSSSGHEQDHDKNFGVGAKVAGATRNHTGLLYLSWKNGVGHMTHLWRDPEHRAIWDCTMPKARRHLYRFPKARRRSQAVDHRRARHDGGTAGDDG